MMDNQLFLGQNSQDKVFYRMIFCRKIYSEHYAIQKKDIKTQ